MGNKADFSPHPSSVHQFDTKPQGTVKLMLSDDFANKTFDPSKLPYCQGKVPCQYVDPWDLNWPIGEQKAIAICTISVCSIHAHFNMPIKVGIGRLCQKS